MLCITDLPPRICDGKFALLLLYVHGSEMAFWDGDRVGRGQQSDLIFYAQSASTVISGRICE